MKAVRIVQGTAVPLDRTDVDTDQIIPSDWLKRVERTGFEKGLFSEWRDDRDFVLNREEYSGANILIGGLNFGTGSSREHAVWAIQQYGFDAVIFLQEELAVVGVDRELAQRQISGLGHLIGNAGSFVSYSHE